MNTPNPKNRSSEQILTEHIFHDARGLAFRAASWLDLAQRTKAFSAFHYSCIDARLSIEHLLFEQLLVANSGDLSPEKYERCLNKRRKLEKLLNSMVPEYEKLQDFTEVIASLSPGAPRIIKWDLKELMKQWGKLSGYLHWSGAYPMTTENPEWQKEALSVVSGVVDSLWGKLCSGHTGLLNLETMRPDHFKIWEEFRDGAITKESAKIRLEILRPVKKRSHA